MEIAEIITQRLEAKGKLFVTRNEFYRLLGAALCRQLGVTPQSSVEALAAVLRTHCQDRFRLAQGGRTRYVARNLPDEAFLVDRAKRLTTFTIGQLAVNLPVAKAGIPAILTRLLERKEVVCIGIRKDCVPLLQWVNRGKGGVHSSQAPLLPSGNDEERFRLAVLEVGQGGNFVPIHRLRARLGWERGRFDRNLTQLRARERILLNMGDPSRMTSEQILDSFLDDNGMLYLTLNWLETGR